MTGELLQICSITAAEKKALKEKTKISFTPGKYENKIEFEFLPEKKLFNTVKHEVKNVSEWFNHCLKKGLLDVKLIAPIGVKDRSILGYVNTTQSMLVCFYKGNKATYFTPWWKFDNDQSVWNVLYTEHEWKDAPSVRPHFENNTDSLKSILIEIKEFALKIDCEYFAKTFQKASDILTGSDDLECSTIMFPDIPEENLRLFKAAYIADVFGAMGSWNDSPTYLAHEKGMDDEYESLSQELLKQVRLAILYAINEW